MNEKAGCTFATKWMFFQQGLLEEALAYDAWVHKYRIDIYSNSDMYRLTFLSVYSDKYIRLKLVRSPYQRAVSSYIHAIRTGYPIPELSKFLGRDIDKKNTFSFEEYLAFLEQTGVRKCDPHHRMQTEKAELSGKLKIDRVIKLEGSISKFRQIEDEYELKSADLLSFSQSIHHHKRINNEEYCGNRKFTRHERKFSQFQLFYNDTLKEKVANLYACDFKQYGYPLDEI